MGNAKVLRGNQTQNLAMTLGEMPVKQTASAESTSRQKPEAQKPEAPKPGGQPHLGVAISDLNADILHHLELPVSTKGVIVADVQEDSAAAEAGLQVADIIQEVDRKPIHNVDEFRTQMVAHSSGPVLFLVNREGHTLYVAIDTQ